MFVRPVHAKAALVDNPQETDEGCLPRWYTEQRDKNRQQGRDTAAIECPNGYRLPGDITVSKRLSFVENWICVFYGYVPMLVIGVAIIEFLYVRGTRELFFVLYVGATTALNELILKRLVQQPRPQFSCATTCGMPSSHSTFATGFFMVMFLDAASRVNPMDVGGEEPEICAMMMQRDVAFVRGPLSNPVTLSNCSFVYCCCQWAFFLLPVPLSRIYLADHTSVQVAVGSIAGVLYAFIFFYFCYEPFAKYMSDKETWRWPRNPRRGTHLLKNTIKLPWWRKQVNPHQVSIVDTEPDSSLAWGRSLVRVEVPVQLAQREGDGRSVGIVHGQKLQVVGGHWSGVAWPIRQDQMPAPSLSDVDGADVDEKGSEVDTTSDSEDFHC